MVQDSSRPIDSIRTQLRPVCLRANQFYSSAVLQLYTTVPDIHLIRHYARIPSSRPCCPQRRLPTRLKAGLPSSSRHLISTTQLEWHPWLFVAVSILYSAVGLPSSRHRSHRLRSPSVLDWFPVLESGSRCGSCMIRTSFFGDIVVRVPPVPALPRGRDIATSPHRRRRSHPAPPLFVEPGAGFVSVATAPVEGRTAASLRSSAASHHYPQSIPPNCLLRFSSLGPSRTTSAPTPLDEALPTKIPTWAIRRPGGGGDLVASSRSTKNH